MTISARIAPSIGHTPGCSLAAVQDAVRGLKKARRNHLRETLAWAFGIELQRPEITHDAPTVPIGYEDYVLPEPSAWEAIFPPKFYWAMCHLLNIPFSIAPEGPLPALLTWEGVYRRLPGPVAAFLVEINEHIEGLDGTTSRKRRHKHHQFLTKNLGRVELRLRIHALTEMMLGAANVSELFASLGRVKGREYEIAMADRSQSWQHSNLPR